MNGEIQAIKEHYANEETRMKQELEAKVQTVMNDSKNDLAQQLSDKYQAARNEQEVFKYNMTP